MSTPLVAVEGGNVTISFVVKDAIPPVQPRNLMWFYSSSFLPTPDGGVNITNTTGRTQISSFSFSAFANSTVSLTITNIVVRGPGGGQSDEGRYFLVASNPAGFSFGFVDVRVQGRLLRGQMGVPRLLRGQMGVPRLLRGQMGVPRLLRGQIGVPRLASLCL